METINITKHEILNCNSNNLSQIENGSINLIVTSPPYPMIEMWDQMFTSQDHEIGEALQAGDGIAAFNKMHQILDKIWDECNRVLADNGFVCINIGDATRTLNKDFQLFSNHTKIINKFLNMGYSVLPDIHWRKQSNSPNKFMGSGMYPAGAYVTYEHEYILIFRKGSKRVFNGDKKILRQKSAFFWEERNLWFSDLWDIKGTSQIIGVPKISRKRSAAFPFEIPYRLINMYSVENDTVLDPFAGLSTTTLACLAAKRNSYSVEIDSDIAALAIKNITDKQNLLNSVIDKRIANHLAFIAGLSDDKRAKCYLNKPHSFLVKTRQETAIYLNKIASINISGNKITCSYI